MRAVVALWILGALLAWTVGAYVLLQNTSDPAPAVFVLALAGTACAATATELVARDHRRQDPPDKEVDN